MKKEKTEMVENPYTDLTIDNIDYQTLLTKKYREKKNYKPACQLYVTAARR